MIYRFADVTLDDATREIRRDGRVLDAEPKVLDLLLHLLRNRGRMVPKDELLEVIWEGRSVSESVMPRAVHGARKLIGRADGIKTHYGRGFRLVLPVIEGEGAPATGSVPPAEAGGDPFMGRETELGLGASCLAGALAGQPHTLLVGGEAGIGKTTLCEHLASLARQRGTEVAWGRCSEVPGAPAYWPWIQLLRAVLGAMEPDRALRLRSLHPEVDALISSIGRAEPAPLLSDSEQARFRIFDGVTEFFRAAATDRPIGLFIDDLHRADTPSLLLFRFLVQQLTAGRILVVAAYRDAEMRASLPSSRLMAELARHAAVRSAVLTGLDREQVGALVEHTMGVSPAPATLDYLLEQTAGNPFYLSQLVPLLDRALDSQNTPLGASERAQLPRSVRDAISSHLSALPEVTVQALTVAAVIGREFDAALVAEVLGIPGAALVDGLDAPIDALLIVPVPGRSMVFRFTHVLIRDALYATHTATRRAELHRSVGEALERGARGAIEPIATQLAHHFTKGAVPDQAVRYAVLAGDLALQALAYEDAARLFESAITQLDEAATPEDGSRCDLLLKLGKSQMRSGDLDAARRTFGRAANLARKIQAPERLATVALDLAPGFFSIETGVFDEYLVERLEEALEALGSSEPMLRVRLLGRLAVALCWTDQSQRRAELCAEAASIAENLDSPEARLHAKIAQHAGLWSPENFNERFRLSEEIIGLSGKLGDRDSMLVARCFRITNLLELGDIRAVREEVGRFKTLAEAARQPECVWMAEMYDVMLALLRGEFARVDHFARASMQLGQRLGHHNALQTGTGYVAHVQAETGSLGGLVPHVEEHVRNYPAVVGWRGFLSLAYSRNGDDAAARRVLARLSTERRSGSADVTWFASMAWLSQTALEIGAKPEAHALYEQLRPCAGRQTVIGFGIATFGAVDHYLGLLALAMEDVGLAIEHLESALDQNRRMEATALAAHSEHALAMALRRRAWPGDRERAAELRDEAEATAARLGMTWLGEQVAIESHSE